MSTATDVSEQVVELAREFAKEKIEPFAAEWDRTKHFPREVIDELGKLGFLGMCTPEEYDGMGLDTLTYLMVLEEISAADAALAVSVGIHNAIPTTMLVKHGTPEQKERWLKPMARGELLAGFALSEAEAGSDAPSLRAHANRGAGRRDRATRAGAVAAVLRRAQAVREADPRLPGGAIQAGRHGHAHRGGARPDAPRGRAQGCGRGYFAVRQHGEAVR